MNFWRGRALLLVLACGLLGGCGRDGQPPTPVGPDTTARTEALLLSVHEKIDGTVDDRRAQDFIAYTTLQGSLRACLAKAGYQYNLPPYVDSYAAWRKVPLPDTYPELAGVSVPDAERDGFGQADQITARRAAVAAARRAPYDPAKGHLKPGYSEVWAACGAALPPYERAGEPDSTPALRDAFLAVLARAVDKPDVRRAAAGYQACVRDAGFPVNSREQMVIAVAERFAPFATTPEGSTPRPLAGPDWTAAVAYERAAAVADARCRAGVHDLTMAQLLAPLEAFVAERAQALATVTAEWAATRAKAAELRTSGDW